MNEWAEAELSIHREEVIEMLEEKHGSPVWVTRSGELVPLAIMSERHMLNIYRKFATELKEMKECTAFYMHPVWGPRGEMAQEAAEQEMEHMWDRQYIVAGVVNTIKEWISKRGFELPDIGEPKPLPKVELIESTELGNIYRIFPE